MSKTCTKCGKEKPFSEFSTSNPTKKDGHNSWCKQCYRESSKQHRHTASGVYSASKGQWSLRHRKPFNMKRREFIKWYEKQEKKCVYCSLPESEIKNIDDPFMNASVRLTLDCKDNYRGYDIDNLVLACRRCNALKNDFMEYWEMVEIGQKYIKPKWEKMLGIKL